MIDVDKAIDVFTKNHPDRTITRAAVYDNRLFVFEALEDPRAPDYNNPYFAIDANTGEEVTFSPLLDLMKFHSAFRDHQITF